MKKNVRKLYSSIAVLAAAVMILAGCGGGGGGGTAPAQKSNLRLSISLPRPANTIGTEYSYSYSAAIQVLSYDASGVGTAVAETSTTLTYDQTNNKYTGSFFLSEIPVGNNYIVKVAATDESSYDNSTAVGRAANTAGYTFAYVGTLVDTIADGVTASAAGTPENSIKALALLKYAMKEGVALSDTTTITDAVKSSISSAVDSLIASGDLTLFTFIYPGYDPFTVSNWDTTMTTLLTTVLTTAELIDTTAPQVSSFYPADGATGVLAESTVFKVIFNESMDSTIDLNDATTLTASGFSINLTKSSTGNSLTIDSTNALSYGTFSWITITNSNDTLAFTLKTNAELEAAGLSTLGAGETISITVRIVPSNLKDAAGNALDTTTNVPTTGSFTTATASTTDTAMPVQSGVSLADGSELTSTSVTVTLTTDEAATCRWGLTAAAYASLANTCTGANSTSQTCAITGLAQGSNMIYIGCTDAAGNSDTDTSGTIINVAVDSIAPTVSSHDPLDGAASVANNGTVFKLVFSEPMDATINLNDQTTLTASGFSLTIVSGGGGTLTIDPTNALDYGVFAWGNAASSYDNELSFTLFSNYTLGSSGLSHLQPGQTYTISSWTPGTGLTDLAGNALDISGAPTTGSFTTTTDDQSGPVLGMTEPYDGGSVQDYQPWFSAVFNEALDTSVDLNNSATLAASGFSITIVNDGTGNTLTIDSTNALSYGSFSYTSTYTTNDTLNFTLNTQTSLMSGGLSYLVAGNTYTITSWTLASNITDVSGNSVEEAAIPTTGSFSVYSYAP